MKDTILLSTFYEFFSKKKTTFLTLFFSVLALSFAKAQQANVGTNLDNGTPWVNGSSPSFTVGSSVSDTGLGTWCSGIIPCNSTESRGIDSNLGQPAVGTIAGIGSVTYRVTDATNTYDAGNFAGFKIGSPRLGIGVGSITIKTYKRNMSNVEVEAESKTFTSLELFLDNGGAYEVGFVTTLAYDAIEISHSSIIIGTSTLNVYHAINKRYLAVASLGCNTPTLMSLSDYPAAVNLNRTGGGGLSISYVNNAEAAVSSSTTDYAELVNVLGIAGSASIAVKDQVTDYPAGTFAGFEIQNVTLLSATVFPNITIETYLTGSNTVVDTYNYSGSAIGATLFGNSGKSILGLVASGAFDEVRISVNMPGGASLSTTRVYGAILTKFCAQAFECNTLTPRVNATLPGNTGAPVYIKSARTGFTGAACVNCSITNTQAVIDNDASNSTIINMVGSVVSTGNLSVANALDTYPKGSFAGFDIESSTLLSASLFGSINISLWNDGTKVQDGVSNSLLTSATTDLLGSENRQIVGIIAKQDFDEVQLSINSILNVSIGQVKVFGMYTQPACAVPATCFTKTNLNNPGSSVVINADNTGFNGGVCAACTINNAWNAVSASTTDFARITNTAGVLVDASLSVASTANTFPAGTFAGFTIKRNNFIVSADIFPSITITTYLDGVEQESETSGNLIDLSLIVQIFGPNSEFFNPGFYATMPFDEVKITIGTLVNALNTYVDVYGAFVDTRLSVNDGSLACSSDTDNDSIPDTVDLDDDNDGILDTVEMAQNGGDTDGDGIPNRIDLDSDNDGISDLEESGRTLAIGADTNGDGSISNSESPSGANGVPLIAEGTEGGAVVGPVDTDNDGHPDPYDLDSDNDSINDLTEGGSSGLVDVNSDGVIDGEDADFDGIRDSADANDGLFGDPDLTDTPLDTDGDGIADFRDLDSDNDGINDLTENDSAGVTDGNSDGVVDGGDADNDGIRDSADADDIVFGDPNMNDSPVNTDGDSVPDYRDLDSDNDSINDITEGGGPGLADSNSDGVVDGPDADNDGIRDSADADDGVFGDPNAGDSPIDTDGDLVPDFRDLDSDNDSINDITEGGSTGIVDGDSDGVVDGGDGDNDGIRDSADANDSLFGDPDLTDSPIDTDEDGIVDYIDLDSDNDGIYDLVESGVTGAIDANADGRVDGPDSDNDGIMDTVDANDGVFGDPEVDVPNNTDGDIVPDYRDLDSDNDGISDVIEADGTDANGDDIADGTINPTTGIPSTAGTGLTPPNTDGTGGTDPYDLDSDGDNISDLIEDGINPIYDGDNDGDIDGTADADADGILDQLDYSDNTYGNEPCLLNIGGGIYNDTDGAINGVDGGQVPGIGDEVDIEMSLVKGNTIVAHTSVGTDGKYLFTNIPHGNYKLVLGTNSNGSVTPEMPTGWAISVEGGNSTGDGTPDGKTNIIVDCNQISFEHLKVAAIASYLNNNFGIKLAGPLSVNLFNFKATQLADAVNLTWKTSEEKDFSHFELERSTDAKEFGSIGTVNGTNASIYNYQDTKPVEGVNYYRLKMVDLSGKASHSKTISVNYDKETTFVSVENPANNGEFKVTTNLVNPVFQMFNASGAKANFSSSKPEVNQYAIKASNYSSGVYFLHITTSGKTITRKVILP